MSHNRFSIKSIGCALWLLGFFLLSQGVGYAQEEPKAAEKKATRIAVIPFQAVLPEEPSSTVQCPICGSVVLVEVDAGEDDIPSSWGTWSVGEAMRRMGKACWGRITAVWGTCP